MREFRPAALVAACLVVLLGISGGRALASVSISPAYVEVRLDKGKPAGEFVVTNTGDEEERYRINCIYFRFTHLGALARVTPDEHSLASWVILNPKELTIPPKMYRKVRYVIVPKGSLRPGEYWACMELESLHMTTASSTDANGHEMKVQLMSSILVPMFGQVGDINYGGSLKDPQLVVRNGAPAVQALTVNEGTGRLYAHVQYEILREGQAVAEGPLGHSYILAGTDRLFTNALTTPLPDGTYTLRVKCTSPQLEEPLSAEATVNWKAPPPAAPSEKSSTAAKPAAGTAPSPAKPTEAAPASPPAEKLPAPANPAAETAPPPAKPAETPPPPAQPSEAAKPPPPGEK